MKIDKISLIIILIMITCLVIAFFYYHKNVINQCTSNPLVYASNQYSNQYGYEFIGYGWFITPINVETKTIYFNSNNITIK